MLHKDYVFNTILSLARPPLRGDYTNKTEANGNFIQLFCSIKVGTIEISVVGSKKKYKYTSPKIQNEIIKNMAFQVLCEIVKKIQDSPFYTLMVDETTDVSNREQVVFVDLRTF